MRKSYDFSKSQRNPYARALKRQITIRLDESTLSYFRGLSGQLGMPYQSLINLYLRDCVTQHRQVKIDWPSKA